MRPTLEPLLLTPLRNAAIHSAWGRGKIDLPPGIAKKLNDTRVFVGSDPKDSRFRKDLAKSLRVERVSDNVKNQKFKVRDERAAQRSSQIKRQQQEIRRLNAEAAKGNREAERQARQLEQQQRKETRQQERVEFKPKAERVGNPAATTPRAAPRPEPRNVRPQADHIRVERPRAQPQPAGATTDRSRRSDRQASAAAATSATAAPPSRK